MTQIASAMLGLNTRLLSAYAADRQRKARLEVIFIRSSNYSDVSLHPSDKLIVAIRRMSVLVSRMGCVHLIITDTSVVVTGSVVRWLNTRARMLCLPIVIGHW